MITPAANTWYSAYGFTFGELPSVGSEVCGRLWRVKKVGVN